MGVSKLPRDKACLKDYLLHFHCFFPISAHGLSRWRRRYSRQWSVYLLLPLESGMNEVKNYQSISVKNYTNAHSGEAWHFFNFLVKSRGATLKAQSQNFNMPYQLMSHSSNLERPTIIISATISRRKLARDIVPTSSDFRSVKPYNSTITLSSLLAGVDSRTIK